MIYTYLHCLSSRKILLGVGETGKKTLCCIAGTAAETGPGEPEAPRHPPTQPKVTRSAQQVSRILYPEMKSLTSLRYTVRPDWI
jgi:hypothetical protein